MTDRTWGGVTAPDAQEPSADISAGATALDRAREAHTLQQQLEALLIVADEPLSAVTLATATDRPVGEVRRVLAALVAEFDGVAGPSGTAVGPAGVVGGAGDGDGGAVAAEGAANASERGAPLPRGFELREVSGGFRFYARAGLDPVVADFVQQQTPAKLSQAALETLAVIAYRQPVSRGAIASIRAVNVDSVVRTLLGRGLITEVGTDPETTATLYGTTDTLLDHLGISDLAELPPIAPLLDEPTGDFDHEPLA